MKYAAVEEYTISHEGDERSRKNPGHGYPASTQIVQTFREFKDEDEMKVYVEKSQKYSFTPKYRIVRFEELFVKTTISVEIVEKE